MTAHARICLALLLFTALVGCTRRQGDDTPAPRVELILFCGAGIRPAADSLMHAFQQRHPGVSVQANYGGSGQQLGQIATNRRGDLFMPGAEFYVDRAIGAGLADSTTKRIVAYFVPVILVRKGNPAGIATVHDLVKPGLRVGFGDERSCAVGKNTLAILAKNRIDSTAIAANVIYKSGTVNELGVAIELNTVDAVIVWDANARNHTAKADAVPIPLDRNDISTIPVVMLSSSRHSAESLSFIEFITSAEGRRILVSRRFTVDLPGQTKPKETTDG